MKNKRMRILISIAVPFLLTVSVQLKAQDYWGYSDQDQSVAPSAPEPVTVIDSQYVDSTYDDNHHATYNTYNYFYDGAPRRSFWWSRPRVVVSFGYGWGCDPWEYSWRGYDPWYDGYCTPTWGYYSPWAYGLGWYNSGYCYSGYPGYWGGYYYGGGYHGYYPQVASTTRQYGKRSFGSTRGTGTNSGNIVDIPGHSTRQIAAGTGTGSVMGHSAESATGATINMPGSTATLPNIGLTSKSADNTSHVAIAGAGVATVAGAQRIAIGNTNLNATSTIAPQRVITSSGQSYSSPGNATTISRIPVGQPAIVTPSVRNIVVPPQTIQVPATRSARAASSQRSDIGRSHGSTGWSANDRPMRQGRMDNATPFGGGQNVRSYSPQSPSSGHGSWSAPSFGGGGGHGIGHSSAPSGGSSGSTRGGGGGHSGRGR